MLNCSSNSSSFFFSGFGDSHFCYSFSSKKLDIRLGWIHISSCSTRLIFDRIAFHQRFEKVIRKINDPWKRTKINIECNMLSVIILDLISCFNKYIHLCSTETIDRLLAITDNKEFGFRKMQKIYYSFLHAIGILKFIDH